MSIRFCCCRCSTFDGFFPEIELTLSGMTPISNPYHYNTGFADHTPVPSAFNANRTYMLPLVSEEQDGGINGDPFVRAVYETSQVIPPVSIDIFWNDTFPPDCPNASPVRVATAEFDTIELSVTIENLFLFGQVVGCNRVTRFYSRFAGLLGAKTSQTYGVFAYPGVGKALAYVATGGGHFASGNVVLPDFDTTPSQFTMGGGTFAVGENYSIPVTDFVNPTFPTRFASDGVTVCGPQSVYSAFMPLVYVGGTAKVTLP